MAKHRAVPEEWLHKVIDIIRLLPYPMASTEKLIREVNQFPAAEEQEPEAPATQPTGTLPLEG